MSFPTLLAKGLAASTMTSLSVSRFGCLRALPRAVHRSGPAFYSTATPRHRTGVPPLPAELGSLQARAEMASPTPSFPQYSSSRRVFVNYNIYKKTSALAITAIHPTFRTLPEGGMVLDRPGSVLLELSHAVKPGERKYDWAKKLTFALSVHEIGKLLADLDNGIGQRGPTEFLHDPYMGMQGGGQTLKTLRVFEFNPPSKDMYISLEIKEKNKGTVDSVGIPVDHGELYVLRESMRFLLSYLMGWHSFVDPSKTEVSPGFMPGMPEEEKVPF